MECRLNFLLIMMMMARVICQEPGAVRPTVVKTKNGVNICTKGWECPEPSKFCCASTISDFFQPYQFENLFSKRNFPVAHAVGFWEYKSFITASAAYQPIGFATVGGKMTQMMELAAFLGHVGSQTSCGYSVSVGGPTAWGLCYNSELSPSQLYCDKYYSAEFPCRPGVSYHGRGAIPLYWNYNYGRVGEKMGVDLLNHPEYIEQNATLAFQAAMVMWMTSKEKNQPSAHQVFTGSWKPTRDDVAAKRIPGFGTTMNILYGDRLCGQGDIASMDNVISHYLYYLDLLGIQREVAGPHNNLTCSEQRPFNPSPTSSST